jgi:hypothetical protein
VHENRARHDQKKPPEGGLVTVGQVSLAVVPYFGSFTLANLSNSTLYGSPLIFSTLRM